MDYDALTAGVAPGGLNNFQQIKLLICYILRSVKSDVAVELLPEMLQYEQLANYFEASQAIDELVSDENLVLTDNRISLTNKGKAAVNELDFILPLSVKEKATRAAVALLTRIHIAKENKVEITQTSNGFSVSCIVYDREIELMRLNLLVPDKAQADAVKSAFMNDPQSVYSGTVNLLMNVKQDSE